MTIGYYAPETVECADGINYNNEADNFAAGLVAAQLVTGSEIFAENVDSSHIDLLKLEQKRLAFVRDLLGRYKGVKDDEVQLVTSLLAASPIARATAQQALRKMAEIAGEDRADDDDVHHTPPTPYREPTYDQNDNENMVDSIK
eukprot:gene1956-2972_t